jgi:uncharacterized protein YbjQ (UPF0145 family)
MRAVIGLGCSSICLLAFAACVPPEGAAGPPASPTVAESQSLGADQDSKPHDDHDGDHDDHDGDHEHHHHSPPRSTSDQAAHVRILQTTAMACGALESLGPVDVHEPMHSEEEALDMLRRRANDLGAEAVLGVEFHHGEGGPAPTHLSGLAVRCGDLLNGRAYDVIQKIDVPGDMGDEDDAYAALKARAASLGADLILGIEFHHGDGSPGSQTHVSGTAVKLRSY